MARILNTRVIYGVRRGFFNGKSPKFSQGPQPPFTPGDYEKNKILLLVNPQGNQSYNSLAKIYRIPEDKKGFDLSFFHDINHENDKKYEKAIKYILSLGAIEVGEVSLEIDDMLEHSALVASNSKEALELKLADYLNKSIFSSDKNINLEVNAGGKTISAHGLKSIERVSGTGGTDFYFKDKDGVIISDFKFSYKNKTENSHFERYKGFISYLKNKIKTSKEHNELTALFRKFYNKTVRHYSYNFLSGETPVQVYEKINLNSEKIKEQFIEFLYGGKETSDHYNFILISNTEPKLIVDTEKSNDENITYALNDDDDQTIYIYPKIPVGNFSPYLVARPGTHGTRVDLLAATKEKELKEIISNIRFFVSPEKRALHGMHIDSVNDKLENLKYPDLENRIETLTNKNFTHAIQTIGLDEPTTAADSIQEHQEKNLHIITELRCLYYSLFE